MMRLFAIAVTTMTAISCTPAPRLRLCWNGPVGVPSRDGDECRHPRRIRWKELPLRVWTDDRDAANAADEFDKWVGENLLVNWRNMDDSDVFIEVLPVSEISREDGLIVRAQTSFLRPRGRTIAHIQVAGNHALPVFTAFVMHELGHVLGLAHADGDNCLMSSPMWPGMDISPEWVPWVFAPPRMCDASRDYLRRLR